MHGQGTYTYADGNIYEGEWNNDNKHGYGIHTWTDGDIYEGAWKNGNMHGYGKYTYPNGDVEEGRWKDDEFFALDKCKDSSSKWNNCLGSHTYSNGDIYDMFAMTAAHKTLPLPTYVRVHNLSNNRKNFTKRNFKYTKKFVPKIGDCGRHSKNYIGLLCC